jgi:hypothetical protein
MCICLQCCQVQLKPAWMLSLTVNAKTRARAAYRRQSCGMLAESLVRHGQKQAAVWVPMKHANRLLWAMLRELLQELFATLNVSKNAIHETQGCMAKASAKQPASMKCWRVFKRSGKHWRCSGWAIRSAPKHGRHAPMPSILAVCNANTLHTTQAVFYAGPSCLERYITTVLAPKAAIATLQSFTVRVVVPCGAA